MKVNYTIPTNEMSSKVPSMVPGHKRNVAMTSVDPRDARGWKCNTQTFWSLKGDQETWKYLLFFWGVIM